MTIKSLEELKKVRNSAIEKMKFRSNESIQDDKTEVLIGMATCGIASGARQTMRAMIDEINKQNLPNVKVVQVGCIGYCHSEPCIQVNIPGQKPIIYGKIDEEKGREIIRTHIGEGKIVDKYVLNVNFDRA